MHGGFATNTMSTTRSCNGNMTKVMYVMMMMVEVAWQYISKWLWNAIIGRYGGCFEEDIRRFMCDRAYHIMGFGCTGEVCTKSQGEKGQCAVPKRLEKLRKGKCAYNPWTHISHKELIYLLQNFISRRSKVLLCMPLGGRLVGKDHRSSPTTTHKEDIQ